MIRKFLAALRALDDRPTGDAIGAFGLLFVFYVGFVICGGLA